MATATPAQEAWTQAHDLAAEYASKILDGQPVPTIGLPPFGTTDANPDRLRGWLAGLSAGLSAALSGRLS